MSTILIVDDEANLRRLLSLVLREEGHQVLEADSLAQARAVLSEQAPELVITDQKLGDGDGLAVLKAVREAGLPVPVLFLTAFATVELAVSAMRAGAFDVIAKPFDPDGVKAATRRALSHAGLLRENERLRAEVGRLGGSAELIGDSPAMQALRELIARVAPTNATALITGETGSGKELVARAIHRQSPRAEASFVPVNCAALPEPLLESELFGHEKGAFTGADRARPGLFETADGGTLFLDEAGEMPPSLQAKLLRVLVDSTVTRLGSRTSRKVDVRIIAATHRDLAERVRQGAFREDLYFRLAVVPLAVPPLRERAQDLPQLVVHFLATSARDLKIAPRRISPGALRRLAGYPFPGNVRELRNLIERALILGRGEELTDADFLLPTGQPSGDELSTFLSRLPASLDMPALLEQIEKALIARALEQGGGVQAEAARRLGLSRSDLNYKLKKAPPRGKD